MHTLPIPTALSQYSLQETLTSGQTFRWLVAPPNQTPDKPLSDATTETFYLPTTLNGHDFVYKITQIDTQTIEWTTLGNTQIEPPKLQDYLRTRLGFTYPYTDALAELKTADEALYKAITPSLSIVQDEPFETTISFICSPQATIDRIYTMQRNLEQQYGTPIKTTDGTFYTFPNPEQLSSATDEELKDCNLGYRASYVRKTVAKLLTDEISLPLQSTTLETAQLREKLKECVGVGTKVADCILLYAYHRTEVIPVDTRIQQMVTARYDETADTTAKAKTALQSVWPTQYSGYYQLLLYDLAAEELQSI